LHCSIQSSTTFAFYKSRTRSSHDHESEANATIVSDGPGIKQIETRLPGPPKRFDALTKLEKLKRTNAKTDPSVATKMLSAVGDFDLKKRKLEFDFDTIQILGLKIPLQQGQAAQLGAKSGLGSKGNVELAKRNRQAKRHTMDDMQSY
jgi:hypothetical protein